MGSSASEPLIYDGFGMYRFIASTIHKTMV